MDPYIPSRSFAGKETRTASIRIWTWSGFELDQDLNSSHWSHFLRHCSKQFEGVTIDREYDLGNHHHQGMPTAGIPPCLSLSLFLSLFLPPSVPIDHRSHNEWNRNNNNNDKNNIGPDQRAEKKLWNMRLTLIPIAKSWEKSLKELKIRRMETI